MKFIPGEYTENAQKMARLWIGWIDYMSATPGLKEIFDAEIIKQVGKKEKVTDEAGFDYVTKGYNIDKLRSTLELISTDEVVAHELSISKNAKK